MVVSTLLNQKNKLENIWEDSLFDLNIDTDNSFEFESWSVKSLQNIFPYFENLQSNGEICYSNLEFLVKNVALGTCLKPLNEAIIQWDLKAITIIFDNTSLDLLKLYIPRNIFIFDFTGPEYSPRSILFKAILFGITPVIDRFLKKYGKMLRAKLHGENILQLLNPPPLH